MAFTNKNNKITVKGFLSSNITEVPNSSYALTFMIKVPRPAQQDRRIIYDEFMVYVCDNKNATNARANLTTGDLYGQERNCDNYRNRVFDLMLQ